MVREQRLVALVAVVLVLLGTVCLVVRLAVLRGARPARGESVYRLTYDIEIPDTEGIRAHIAIPSSTEHCRVFRESFSHHGFWMDMVKSRRTYGREVVVVPAIGFKQGRLTADFDIHLSKDQKWKKPVSAGDLTTSDLSHYLRQEPNIQHGAPIVSTTLAKLKADTKSKSDLLERIYEHCLEHIISIGPQGAIDAAGTLERGSGATLGHVRAMIALCRAARIPARLVCGFALETALNPQPHYWVEIRVKKSWCPYDPVYGYREQLPPNLLPIRYDDPRIFRSASNVAAKARFSIRRILPNPVLSSPTSSSWLSIGDLTRLPPGMQAILALVLLLPVGALVTAVLRNLVGIRTYGTFTPALIALSFVQADWRTGVIVFLVVLGVGTLARLLLDRLKLLMVPRLGVILCLVVVTMIIAVSLLDFLGLTPTASAVLLPMVILTMMVERFSITAEEDSNPEAVRVLAGTLLTALCCLLVLREEHISYFVLSFPEIILFVAAALVLLGRYAGYRFAELWRFRDLAFGHPEEWS